MENDLKIIKLHVYEININIWINLRRKTNGTGKACKKKKIS